MRACGDVWPEGDEMILSRLMEHRDKSSLGGALIKGGAVVVKAGKLVLALASFAAYAFLFTWQFAVVIVGMLVIHECGHLRCMKHYGMKTRGIYLIPLLGAAAVAEDNFPSRKAETTIALAGPVTGAVLAGGTGMVYFATGNGAFAAAAAWMALINLFNLLPVVPLDGGRVVKSITCSIGSRVGLVAVIAGMLLGAVLAATADLWIFVIVIPLGLLDYLYDRRQDKQAERRARREVARGARMAAARHTSAAGAARGKHARGELPEDEADVSTDDAVNVKGRVHAAKPPLGTRAAGAAFACYAALAVLLWLFMLAMSGQPGAAAAMHALQG
jgi:Zn-dependent protease